MIKVNLRDFTRLSRDFETIQKRALPHATRQTLNDLAFKGRGLWQDEMQRRFILRNDFTTRRVFVDKATGTNIPRMKSVLSSPNENLVKQEQGGVETHAIPTGIATGEGRGVTPQHRLVRRPNKVSAITLGARVTSGTPAQRNAAAIQIAARKGQKFVFLQLRRRKGLFKVVGGRRSPRVEMVWDTTRKSVKVKPHPTLGPAVRRLDAMVPSIMQAAVVQQFKHYKVFGY